MEHLATELGKYEKIIKKMADSCAQKESDYVVCEQRLKEVQDRAAHQRERVDTRVYSMNDSIVSSKRSKKINDDEEEEGSE